ncbi:UDP-N-acetylmuramoyl-tripeptide--D-alanyl-D-alanine ligase [Bacteriovorax sp. Seq25_V]|uniref:UDP-N-acetylmuramoyl-tripeptide--D-alanyl-D- alanine ligase n=1 Tax=Bacteriovorax sp. Seq25_V TaxID=1201288 RepID=UPI00038A4958|nr:Mur ligase family protein [Bacteriovorax sp. Seq25_V]EQC43524.1 Mur ligase central domain protein [Bacteriovorax sp. Seq25_V]
MKIIDFKNIKGIKYSFGSFSDREISLTTDSRNTEGKNVFIALKGDNFDGYKYLAQTLESGVEVVVFESGPEEENRQVKVKKLFENYADRLFICVENSLEFLQASAAYWIRKWQSECDGKVLSLTGSNGKTTTKELLLAFSKIIFDDSVISTSGNLNNHIGVPLTIFEVKPTHRFAIIEMGTNHPGEIEVLCNIANPNFGLITNIGSAHIEFLKSEEGILEEKGALYRYVTSYGEKFFLNKDDPYLSTLETKSKVIEFNSDDLEKSLVNKGIKEDYNQFNLKFAYFVIKNLFPEESAKLTNNFSMIKLPANKRSQWITIGEKKIFLDAYNANPSSMRKAIESICTREDLDFEKSLFVCGDMNELGERAPLYHNEIGELLKMLGVKHVAFVGRYAKHYKAGFGDNALVFEQKSELETDWKKLIESVEFIFLKASRSLQLESLIDITY